MVTAAVAFLVAAVINWWQVVEKGAAARDTIPAIGFTLAFVLLVIGQLRKRAPQEKPSSES